MPSESREGTGNRHTFQANDYSIRLAPSRRLLLHEKALYFRGGPLQARYTWMIDSRKAVDAQTNSRAHLFTTAAASKTSPSDQILAFRLYPQITKWPPSGEGVAQGARGPRTKAVMPGSTVPLNGHKSWPLSFRFKRNQVEPPSLTLETNSPLPPAAQSTLVLSNDLRLPVLGRLGASFGASWLCCGSP